MAPKYLEKSVFKLPFGIIHYPVGAKCDITVRTDEKAAVLLSLAQPRPVAINILGVRAWPDHPPYERQICICRDFTRGLSPSAARNTR